MQSVLDCIHGFPIALQNIVRIEHIAWQVSDPVAVAGWYGREFGLTVLRKFNTPAQAHFLADESGNVILEIYNNPKVSVPDYKNMDPLLLHIAFLADDLAGTRDNLVAAGATLVDDIAFTPAGDQIVMLRDPWGFAVQLVRRKEPMLAAG